MRSILKITGLVPSLQQAIIMRSSLVQPFIIEPPCNAVYTYLLTASHLATEFTIHHVVEIILLLRAFEQEGITWFEERTWAGLGIGKILLLKLRKTHRFQNCYFTFVLNNDTSIFENSFDRFHLVHPGRIVFGTLHRQAAMRAGLI